MTTINKITFSLILVILIISILCQSFMYIAGDIGWRLHITQQFLAGGNYVTHFLDKNPPILLYEYIPAVLIAKYFSFSLATALRISIYLLAATSLWLCYRISEQLFAKERALFISVLIVLSIIFLLTPAMEFGGREHLVLLFIIPYLLYSILRTTEKRVSNNVIIWTSIFAGFAFITNLSFLLLFALIELFVILKQRHFNILFRKEMLIILSIFGLYLISIFIFTPNYIHIILPMTFFLYSPALFASWKTMLLNSTSITWLFTVILFPFHYKRSSYKSTLSILLIALSFSFLLFVVARKAWYTNMIPSLAFSFLILTIYLIEDMKNIRYLKSSNIKAETTLLVTTILSYAIILLFPIKDIFVYNRSSIDFKTNPTNEINLVIDYVKQQAEGKLIYVFSDSVNPGATLLHYAHVALANKMPSLWMLPGILQKSKEKLSPTQIIKLKKIKKLMFDTVIKSFNQHHPTLVIVQAENPKIPTQPHSFNIISYFSQNPRFKKIWSQYHFTYQINQYRMYIMSQ